MGVVDAAKKVLDAAIPDGQTERFIFRKFDGAGLARAAESGSPIRSKDVDTVILKINPQELTWNSSKIINKVPTNAPGRFIVFDWGNDLTMIGINGSTGDLLPSVFTTGFDPLKGTINDIAQKIIDAGGGADTGVSSYKKGVDTFGSYAAKILQAGMSYFELLEMSPKYRTFKKLEAIYEDFDADMDVLTMEMGRAIYRGYFTEFRFTVTKDSPWNWSYNVSFVRIIDLSKMTQKEDEDFNDSNVESE